MPSPRADAEVLLAHVTGRPRALLAMAGSTVEPERRADFERLVTARSRRIPLQLLIGSAPFRHLELRLGPGVFIPRPETELMVDHVHRFAAGLRGQGLVVVDLCAGSGALALSVATEIADSRVLAVEVSDEALRWAERNRVEHRAQLSAARSSLELIGADATRVADPAGALSGYRGGVDVVLSNPPYVPQDAVPREPEVRDHDPALALYGGPDGLDVIRLLADQAAILLRPGGMLVLEHADVQGEGAGSLGVPGVLRAQRIATWETTAIERRAGEPPGPGPAAVCRWSEIVDHPDLAGRPRHTCAVRGPGR